MSQAATRSRAGLAVLALLAASALAPVSALAGSAEIVVDTTADDGAGSLRQAIVAANAAEGVDRIVFAIPEKLCSAEGVCTIALATSLPGISGELEIDGTTQPRYGTAPENVCATWDAPSHMRVEVTNVPLAAQFVAAAGLHLHGLSVGGKYPVVINSFANHRIQCNHIGVDAVGSTKFASVGAGICISCFSFQGGNAVIGTDGDGIGDVGERNVVAGQSGIVINTDGGNVVAGNYVCLAADGLGFLNCANNAISVGQIAPNNRIGTNSDGISDAIEGNWIGSAFTGIGAAIEPTELGNRIAGNHVGTNLLGESGGVFSGIRISWMTPDLELVGNRIEGALYGLQIADTPTFDASSTDNCLIGNDTGVDHGGTDPVDLANTWWGDPSGPSGTGPGTGDSIVESSTGVVSFTPWLTALPHACEIAIFLGGFESGSFADWIKFEEPEV